MTRRRTQDLVHGCEPRQIDQYPPRSGASGNSRMLRSITALGENQPLSTALVIVNRDAPFDQNAPQRTRYRSASARCLVSPIWSTVEAQPGRSATSAWHPRLQLTGFPCKFSARSGRWGTVSDPNARLFVRLPYSGHRIRLRQRRLTPGTTPFPFTQCVSRPSPSSSRPPGNTQASGRKGLRR